MTTPGAYSNRVGLRRLFEAPGCSLSSREEVAVDLKVSEQFDVRIYLGPKPEHGIQIVSDAPKYIVPGEPILLGEFTVTTDVTTTSYAGKFFVEIAVSCMAEPIRSGSGTDEARAELLTQAQAREPEFRNIIDLVAGIVGLRFHRQLVLEPLDENSFIWEGEIPVRSFAGPSHEVLEPVGLTDYGISQLESYRSVLQNIPEDPKRKMGLIFHWLLRAWRERDLVYRFVALFLPLEAVLSSLTMKPDAKQREYAETIRRIIREHAQEDRAEIIALFNRGFERLSPTLDDRFVALAEEAKLPGWEGDIEAFRKFKRMRNALVHKGDIGIQHRLSIGPEEVHTLSDLVERYVNYVIFRDGRVYQTQWRPQVRQEAEREGA